MYDRLAILSGFVLGIGILIYPKMLVHGQTLGAANSDLAVLTPVAQEIKIENTQPVHEETTEVKPPVEKSSPSTLPTPRSSSGNEVIGGAPIVVPSPVPSPLVSPHPTPSPEIFLDPTPHPDLIKKVIPSPHAPIDNPIIPPPRIPLDNDPIEGIDPPLLN